MLVLSLAVHFVIVVSTDAGSQHYAFSNRQKWQFQVTIQHLNLPKWTAQRPVDTAELQSLYPESRQVHENVPIPDNATSSLMLKHSEDARAINVIEKKYYSIKELDVVPEPIGTIDPKKPEDIPRDIHGGLVRVQVLLDENGIVTDATVLSSTPPGYFDDAAREAFVNAKFTPGIRQGKSVPTRLTLQVHFGEE